MKKEQGWQDTFVAARLKIVDAQAKLRLSRALTGLLSAKGLSKEDVLAIDEILFRTSVSCVGRAWMMRIVPGMPVIPGLISHKSCLVYAVTLYEFLRKAIDRDSTSCNSQKCYFLYIHVSWLWKTYNF